MNKFSLIKHYQDDDSDVNMDYLNDIQNLIPKTFLKTKEN